ncbi:hypothetical protein THYS13_13640 [Thermoanaerobacter sp. YS13]|uniref:hypothetical protein n=1 Tax=Thermoanaerobacter sp. YS13 TaxID=1511746 RepID=UPI00057430A8|nr:hypothetical protein [Thermoanaerobacter sp. YS13]KHO63243.1 hypothetical protein THYS13_13640 [Thermoanaerobacter sp. YS13]
MKKIAAAVLIIFLLSCIVPAYADYVMSDGTTVKWLGGNQIQVTDPTTGQTYVTTGIMTDNGHLVPPQKVASSGGQLNTSIATRSGQTETLAVTPGYSINGTNYYYAGTDNTLITVSNGQVSTTSATRMGDRLVPTSALSDSRQMQAVTAAINATGGWWNYSGSTYSGYDGSGSGGNISSYYSNTTNSTMLGNATIIGDMRTLKVEKPDGSTLLLDATEFQGGWAGDGAYVIPYRTLDQSTIDYLKQAGFVYDDKTGVFILQFTKKTDQYANNWNWKSQTGYVITGDPSIDNAIDEILQEHGITVPDKVVGLLDKNAPVMTKLQQYYNELVSYFGSDAFTGVGDAAIFLDQFDNYQAFVNEVLNYATHSGIATFRIPGDNSNGTSPTPPPQNSNSSQNNNPPTVNPPPSNGSTPSSGNVFPVRQLTADDVHATITINKTPNFVYTKWHTDANGYPAYMDITIKWKNVEIGSIIDTPDGPHEVRTPAYVTNVVAFHNIHRYTDYVLADDNWETEYPVMQNIDIANQQATFRFMYRKAGQEDSTLYFKLYLNGTDKYFCVYVHIPVNGFNATFFQDNQNSSSNPGFKTSNPNWQQTNIQTETITF